MGCMEQFDELKSSALKELANVGISHVATAIGEIAREKIDVSVPEFGAFSKDQLLRIEKTADKLVGAYLTVDGISELTEALILLSKKDALGLMDKFVNVDTIEKVDPTNLSVHDQVSIFSEISTVISASYFSAVDSMFNLRTNCGVPKVSFENGGLVEFINKTLRQNEGVSVRTSFVSEKSKIEGRVILFPDPKTIDLFFKSIGISS